MNSRDIYLAIANLCKAHAKSTCSLEEYLRTLLGEFRRHSAEENVPCESFVEILDAGFSAAASPYDPQWDTIALPTHAPCESFGDVERLLLNQIVDLHQMASQGMLANEMRYFGLTSPRGRSWYNFDARTFIECAAEGYFHGWQPGDETPREFVPGKVAVLNDLGEIMEVDPGDIVDPVLDCGQLPWTQIGRFLECGQWYE